MKEIPWQLGTAGGGANLGRKMMFRTCWDWNVYETSRQKYLVDIWIPSLELSRDLWGVDKYFGAIVLVVMVQAMRREEMAYEEG